MVAATGEIGYADSDGVQIAYKVLNEGERDLVFVPGFVSHLEIIGEHPLSRRLLERLCSFARVILMDRREQGLSDRLGRPPTLEEGAADLRAVLDAVGSERATLLGISEGGPMSMLFAASHPDRTEALVPLNTYARLTRAPDYPAGLLPERMMATLDSMTSNWGTAATVRLFAPSMVDDEAFVEWWGRMLRSGSSPRGARDLMELYLEIDVRDVLPAIHAPALVLHREGDRLLPAALGRYLADHLPNARFVALPGRDHLFFVGEVDEMAEEIEELMTGQRSARRPERILTTILFTDIVGSTRTAAEVGDRRWRELLATHHDVVRRELDRHGGHEVNTTGDGFLASFDGPARAVRCARALVERTGAAGIPIRAGVHTGEVEVMNGDLGGLAVHIGARVGALAGAGEVLVTGTVRDLVVGSELRFSERGEQELSGVPGSWRLFAVAGE
jgi:class 3 adenylate cyclase